MMMCQKERAIWKAAAWDIFNMYFTDEVILKMKMMTVVCLCNDNTQKFRTPMTMRMHLKRGFT